MLRHRQTLPMKNEKNLLRKKYFKARERTLHVKEQTAQISNSQKSNSPQVSNSAID